MDREQREQIIKSLECCGCVGIPLHDCSNCVYKDTYYCQHKMAQDSLALIKELTKENAKLQYDILSTNILLDKQREEDYKAHQETMKKLQQIYDGIVQLKANTIQRLQEKVALHFGTYTLKDEVKVLDVIRLINQSAEEILEEG